MKVAGHFDKRGADKKGRRYNRNYYAFIYLDAFSYVLVLLLVYFFFRCVFSRRVDATVSN